MFSYLLFLLLSTVYAAPPKLPDLSKERCCLDHSNKPDEPLYIANYDCSQLTPFGKDRCNEIFQGSVCKWGNSKKCKPDKCKRLSHFESHMGQSIDVGKCSGLCSNNLNCAPTLYSTSDDSKFSNIIKECGCKECSAVEKNTAVVVPLGTCRGKCETRQHSKVCIAGVNDNFLTTNLEPSNPSLPLLSGILSTCSAGVQSGFDIFIDNRCFGHTFTNCVDKGPCPLKKASLEICMQASQVPLTNTDSLILGFNGGGVWSKSLPDLNSGSWNPGDVNCLTLDLDNLPIDGASILNALQSTGHLDVVVQDDTAVDYVNLEVIYEKCQKCLPIRTSINTLYHDNGITNFLNVKDCDCLNVEKCTRAPLIETYFSGTKFEATIDKGQCLGKCQKTHECVPTPKTGEIFDEIAGPEGMVKISKIVSCECQEMKWVEL
jgi:hypothetical protein